MVQDATTVSVPDTTTEVQTTEPKAKRPRGFAAMDPTVVREIARKGGKAAQAMNVAHRWTQDEAREAGRKGGRATGERTRAAKEKVS